MRFHLIGPFRIVTDDGRVLPPPSPKVAQVLAVLLTPAGDLVTPGTLIRELWHHDPPRSALNTVQTYVHHARRALTRGQEDDGGPSALTTGFGGYTLRADETSVDAAVFGRLVARGREELHAGRAEEAVATLDRALALWRGPVLSGVPTGPVLAGRTVHLEELRIRAFELRVDAMRRLGRLRELVPVLRTLVHDHPLNEWFHAQLIDALRLAGRRAEALEAYRALHRVLRDELGLAPSPDVQRLHRLLLGRPTPPEPPSRAAPPYRESWDSPPSRDSPDLPPSPDSPSARGSRRAVISS
ncbi:BTAD domain-containing putative transcriptional regulator [Streptomyces sp. NPDC085460]|uniref:AfsR/SARP family transcriptional regulator n=1 Tax=Streptomyces sp. NPDC085460 TaxID=3365723 RepID=UPI0037CEC1B3